MGARRLSLSRWKVYEKFFPALGFGRQGPEVQILSLRPFSAIGAANKSGPIGRKEHKSTTIDENKPGKLGKVWAWESGPSGETNSQRVRASLAMLQT